MLTISQVSERTGLTPYTIRYYEKIGVLQGTKSKKWKDTHLY
nr:MerR family DNA-binding transcriptional regulator [Paenibacillus sp. Mc5Re-14]